MSEQDNRYWWCPNCKEEKSWNRVTFQGLCDDCGYPVARKTRLANQPETKDLSPRQLEAREKIARELDNAWHELDKSQEARLIIADAILALTDSEGKPLLAVLAKDQTLPRNPWNGDIGYQAQQDMAETGWRRTA